MDCGCRLAVYGAGLRWPHLPGETDMDTKEFQLTENFTLRELTRSQTAARKGIYNLPPQDVVHKLRDLCVQILEPVRLHYGVPIVPSSGYRSPELNAAVGGSKTSQHCKGEAVDFEVPGVSNYDLADWMRKNLILDQLILECHTLGKPHSGWVHVSYKAGANRRQVLTYSGGKYFTGLVA